MTIPFGRELDGRVALVTGGARNIGRAIALALAEAGAAVVINARGARAEAEAVAGEVKRLGAPVLVHLADVTDPDAVATMFRVCRARLGRLDVLVNNAALRKQTPLARITHREWRDVLSVAVDGTFLCSQAAAPLLAEAGGGAIVNLGGLTAHTGAAGRAHAVTAKAAVIGLTKALAVELAPQGTTVNCVVPGTIETVRGATAGAMPETPKNLLGRLGQPDEIAAMVRLLAGPAGRYVTGQTIHVSGGAYLP